MPVTFSSIVDEVPLLGYPTQPPPVSCGLAGRILSSFSSAYMIQPVIICRRLFRQAARLPCSRARFSAGIRMAIKMAITAMTTRSSIKVKACRRVISLAPSTKIPMRFKPDQTTDLLFYRPSRPCASCRDAPGPKKHGKNSLWTCQRALPRAGRLGVYAFTRPRLVRPGCTRSVTSGKFSHANCPNRRSASRSYAFAASVSSSK